MKKSYNVDCSKFCCFDFPQPKVDSMYYYAPSHTRIRYIKVPQGSWGKSIPEENKMGSDSIRCGDAVAVDSRMVEISNINTNSKYGVLDDNRQHFAGGSGTIPDEK